EKGTSISFRHMKSNHNDSVKVIESASGCWSSSQLAVVSNHIALREICQGYRGIPGQNSRSASSPSLLSSFSGSILSVLALPQFSQKA
ncbi:TPA: hypothetical protein ACIO89_004815, partial [Salmonella enterica subsp. enterica serovar Java]